jgi:glucose-6-phosphate 1-dehydrogenase
MESAQVIQARGPEPAAPRHPVRAADPATVVIFGATGDLTDRKLLPALFSLWHDGYLASSTAVVAAARRDKTDSQFRDEHRRTAEAHLHDHAAGNGSWDDFARHLFYQRTDFGRPDDYRALAGRLAKLDAERGLPGNRLYYLATDPEYFAPIVANLAGAGLVRRDAVEPWTRVIIEKPFGHDLDSARALDHELSQFVREDQLYRIDHYLGKETVQSLLTFRFGNSIFEPIFNRRYVDHIQITTAETVGMEGRRGAYYDHAGALRDVVQNHLLQLLALVAMEPPAGMTARDIHDEKLKVLRSLVPLTAQSVGRRVVRGQYGPGRVEGKAVPGYRQEEAVSPDSNTDTYVALCVEVDNWRWAGVPFHIRTGKRLPRRLTEIAVQFKLPPLRLFRTVECEGDECDVAQAQPNVLVFSIQPDEGISLSFSTKRPGMSLDMQSVRMDFRYGQAFRGPLPEAYERLLLDALRGDATLFMRSDELIAAWEFITPILQAWQDQEPPKFPNYEAGSWGPVEADRLLQGCRGGWRQP